MVHVLLGYRSWSRKKVNYVLGIQIPKTSKDMADDIRKVKIASAICSVNRWKMQKKSGLILFFLNEVKEFKENESDAEMVIMVVNYYQAKGVEVMNSARKFLMKGFMVRKKML